MENKLKKIDREFCLTDDSVNVYGYRLLTSGFLLDIFKKNPIGYYMHHREGGAVLRWEDFRIEGDKVYARPVINLANARGQQTADEVENGFLNAASCGRIVVLEASDAPELMLEGQTGPTITRWYCKELSLVDIPGNSNAFANLYDENDNEIAFADLADFVNPKSENMSKLILAATMLTALNLSDKSSQDDLEKAFGDLVDRAAKGDKAVKDLADMTTERDALKKEKDELETKNKELADASVAKEVKDLLDAAQTATKVTVALRKTLEVDYATNPKGLKDLLDNMQPQTSVIPNDKDAKDVEEFKNLSWDALYKANKLQELKEKHPDLYEAKRNEKYPNLKG